MIQESTESKFSNLMASYDLVYDIPNIILLHFCQRSMTLLQLFLRFRDTWHTSGSDWRNFYDFYDI